jgi:hypothetical protein
VFAARSHREEPIMSEAPEIAPRFLSDTHRSELLDVIRELDSVELKLTIPMDEHRATLRGLPIDPVEAEPRQVFFFDTPDLALNQAGVVVRARRISGGYGDTVVKLRPVVPANLPDDVKRSGSFKLEVDIVPGGYMVSGSMKGKASGDEIRAVAAETRRLGKILSKEQRAFYRAHAPADISLDGLEVLGPTFSLKTSFVPKQINRKVNVEMWLYPDGSRLLELSTKCRPIEAGVVGVEFRSYLAKRGIGVSGAQEAKTRVALEFYTAQIKRANEPGLLPASEAAVAAGK